MHTYIITQNSGFVITITNVRIVESEDMHTLCLKNLTENMHIIIDNAKQGSSILGDVHIIRIDIRTIVKMGVR